MDLFLVLYPHGNPVVNFGVTTVVIGDCGASCAPVPEGREPLEVLVNYLKRVLDDYIDPGIWQWRTYPEYLSFLRRQVGINVAALVPHSPIRLAVMGEAAYQREATVQELEAMKRLVREGLEAGAVGFSSSPRGGPEVHAGTPSTFATQDEIVQLANLAGEYGGCFQFNGFGNLLKPESGYPALVERIQARMIGNEFRLHPGELDEGPRSLRLLEDAQGAGKEMYGVVIPYSHIRRFGFEDAFLFEGLPTWEAIRSAPQQAPQRLADPQVRANLERERVAGAGRPAFPEWRGWGRVIFDQLEATELKHLEGKTVPEAAQAAGTTPAEAFFDTWLADHLHSRFLYYGFANGDLDVLGDMITSPHSVIGTDAGAHLDRFFWHGTPARLLGHWCREQKLLSLEEAVWKLTGFAGSRLGLHRGQLKVGWPADITVFDPDRIQDLVSERLPQRVDQREVERHPPGVHAVVVNGQVAAEAGECLDVYAGKVGDL
jgi:N-acyl-D-aspartate/D-glutamate deacylase